MKLPLEIAFQGLSHSDAIEAAVIRHATKLERFCTDIMRCRVGIILDEKHQHQGKRFKVHIHTTISGHELVSNRECDEDVYVALRDAFKDTVRMIEDAVRKRRGDVKQHMQPLQGVVVSLDREQGYGFIRAADENDYYFGPDNLNGLVFDQLKVGTPVHFIAEMADEGRQAKRICKDARRLLEPGGS